MNFSASPGSFTGLFDAGWGYFMSDELKQLDSVRVPLEGINLVEAAAGTGKTYNIQNLVVRLLLEKALNISQIAVLSFTNEAAAELASRIRRVFDLVLAVLENRPAEGTEQAEALVGHDRELRPDVSDKERISVIKEALRDFDLANISTINGFCQKLLQRFAFESGTAFSARLETNTGDILTNILDDWMRSKLYSGENSQLYLALIKPDDIYKLKRYVLDFNLKVPEYADGGFFAAAEELKTAFSPGMILEYLGKERFNANSKVASRMELFETAMKELDWQQIIEYAEIYTPDNIIRSARAAHRSTIAEAVANEPFFNACEKLFSLRSKAVSALKAEALAFALNQFNRIASNGNFMTFADQIRIVDEALKNSDGFRLKLREKFKAGIIDEFQDTDAAQYRIFKALFDGDDRCAFLVGDPRQAIYRFRGGDINAYLSAKKEILHRGNIYRLGVNFRSSVKMVEAVNRIFAVHPRPFGSADISFPELASRAADKAPELLVDGVAATEALFRWSLDDTAADSWKRTCVRRIAYLLSPEASERLPDGSRLKPGDIALLVRSNDKCAELRRELEKFNIPAVCLKSGSVYAGVEAAELYTVLDAVINPGSWRKVSTALACGMCQVPLSELNTEGGGSDALLYYRELFCRLQELWQKKGFVYMFETFLREFNVREKLAVQPDGERHLTNLVQLEELLLQLALAENLSPERLFSQFGALIASSSDPEEKHAEHEELMVSDSSCVRIMTIHASKGLQFPVVIIPGTSQFKAPGSRNLNGFFFNGTERELNLDADPEKFEKECRELYDEMCRLIYVAVTRSEFRCEVFEEPGNVETVWHDLLQYSDLELELCTGLSGQHYVAEKIVLKTSLPEIPVQYPRWQVISYSALTRDVISELTALPQDHDEVDELYREAPSAAVAELPVFSPFNFSGGTGFGNIIHSCFEKIDFSGSKAVFHEAAVSVIRQSKIELSGNAKAFTAGCGEWLYGIFHAPLDDWQGGSFTLSEIAETDRLMEMEFCCSLNKFSTAEISRVLNGYVTAEFGQVNYPDNWEKLFPGGILTGFIDMVFRRNGRYYIVDWKTNSLDNEPANFQPGKLGSAMVHGMYFMQYLLYMAALVRHLRRFCGGKFGEAEYENMIGGVYYLFVRGISPDVPGRGVFRSRPPWQTISVLEELLCPKM